MSSSLMTLLGGLINGYHLFHANVLDSLLLFDHRHREVTLLEVSVAPVYAEIFETHSSLFWILIDFWRDFRAIR